MEALYVFMIRNDVWIYIICGLGLIWYLNELISSQRALSRAMFGLERETALRTRNKALVLVVFFATVVSSVVYVNTEVRDSIPPERLRPPTPDMSEGLFLTPTPTVSALQTEETEGADATPTSPIAPTVTLPGQSVSPVTTTITATATITGSSPLPSETLMPAPAPETTVGPQVAGCSPDAIISEPREGVTVLGLLTLFGSANTPDFAFYEIEIRGPQTNDRWASLVGRRIMQPVSNGILAGNVDLSAWDAGSYDIRLLITNGEGNITHQCGVSVVLGGSGG